MANGDLSDTLGVNLGTVARYGTAGLLAGGGAAALIAALKHMRELEEQRRKKDEDPTMSGDTIVLTLPKTAASKCTSIKKEEGPSKSVHDRDGKFGKKTYPTVAPDKLEVKQANWQTLVAALLALPTGGYLGFKGVEGALSARKRSQLESELKAARQEYLDKLVGTSKEAQAAEPSFGNLDYVLGIPALLAVLGAGGTAWLTKRVLDNYDRGTPDIKKDPQVKKILYRVEGSDAPSKSMAPSMTVKTVEEKEKEEEENTEEMKAAEVRQAMLGVFLDICSGEPHVLTDDRCLDALMKSGETPTTVYKAALSKNADDYANLVEHFQNNPELRTLVKRVSMDKHPLLKYMKWSVNLPGIREYSDQKLYKGLQDALGKTAGVGKALMTATLGSTISNELSKPELEAKKKKEEEEKKPKTHDIDVIGQGPEADEFIERNKEQILRAILELKKKGLL